MKCYRCLAECWDHAWFRIEGRGKRVEVIECAFCGALDSRPAAATSVAEPRAAPAVEEFVFGAGRFAGKTLAEVVAHPRGRDYLEWARQNNSEWKPFIERFIDSAALSAQSGSSSSGRMSRPAGGGA